MVSFSFLFAPLIFSMLKPETAGRLVRGVFPWYYLSIAVLCAVAAMLLVSHDPWIAGGVVVVAAAAVLARQLLIAAINMARDQQMAGDSAGRLFARLHGGFVALNLVQIAILIAVLRM